MRKPVNPFSGLPKTRVRTNKAGYPEFRILSLELTPLGAKICDRLSFVGGLGSAAWVIMTLLKQPNPPITDFVCAFAAYVVTRFCLSKTLPDLFTGTVTFKLDMDRIDVWSGIRPRSFDRHVPHRFLIVPHRLAHEERQRNDFAIRKAQMRGKAIRPPEYYGQSSHIALEYDEQIFVLCTIYGLPAAEALLRRLQLCEERLNQAAKAGGQVVQDGTEKWVRTAGGLNDE